jgi:hypothetical protein
MTLQEGFEQLKEVWFNKITLLDNTITLYSKNFLRVEITDEGQQCCENRFIHTEDNLEIYGLGKLIKLDYEEIEVEQENIKSKIQYLVSVPQDPDDEVEMAFLKITFQNIVTINNFMFNTYNIHKGYYGGFMPELRIYKISE